MKRSLEIIRKHWTRVWLICIALLTGGVFVAYAAYTEISSVKRVVSTTAAPGELFSSNCMRADISSRRLTSSEYTITVCNFDQEKPTTYNSTKINYALNAELQIKRGDKYLTMSELKTELNNEEEYQKYVTKAAKYFIFKTEDDESGSVTEEKKGFSDQNGFKVTFDSDALASQKSSTDKYKVEIDKSDLSNTNTEFFIHVWAEPSYPHNLSIIEARLYGAKIVADTASWTGSFLESDCEMVDYDFYNYIITGSGVGTVDILWDPNKFVINPFFLDPNLSGNSFVGDVSTITNADEKYGTNYAGWKKITLKVNSTQKNRYELQLYKTPTDSKTGISYTGENAAEKYIVCQFNK